jgi:universal stress protein A
MSDSANATPHESIRSVLVAIDFSACSRAALSAAAEWAERLGACLDVVHVCSVPSFPLPPAIAGDQQVYEVLIERPRKQAEAILASFVESASNSGIYVRKALLEFGSVPHGICELAERGGYDLLVVGTHGHSGFSRAVLGSVAEKVVRTAPCPVLTVHEPAAHPTLAA